MKKANTLNIGTAMVDLNQRHPDVRVSIPGGHKLTKKIQGLQIGRKIHLEMSGIVKGVNMDEHEHSLRINLKTIVANPGIGQQLDDLRESRRF